MKILVWILLRFLQPLEAVELVDVQSLVRVGNLLEAQAPEADRAAAISSDPTLMQNQQLFSLLLKGSPLRLIAFLSDGKQIDSFSHVMVGEVRDPLTQRMEGLILLSSFGPSLPLRLSIGRRLDVFDTDAYNPILARAIESLDGKISVEAATRRGRRLAAKHGFLGTFDFGSPKFYRLQLNLGVREMEQELQFYFSGANLSGLINAKVFDPRMSGFITAPSGDQYLFYSLDLPNEGSGEKRAEFVQKTVRLMNSVYYRHLWDPAAGTPCFRL